MGEYRFGLHSGEVSEYLFGVHYGHLTAPADLIAGRHGAWHVNYTDPHGQRRGWFACPNRGAQFDQAIARAVMADIDRVGGIESLRREERDPEHPAEKAQHIESAGRFADLRCCDRAQDGVL